MKIKKICQNNWNRGITMAGMLLCACLLSACGVAIEKNDMTADSAEEIVKRTEALYESNESTEEVIDSEESVVVDEGSEIDVILKQWDAMRVENEEMDELDPTYQHMIWIAEESKNHILFMQFVMSGEDHVLYAVTAPEENESEQIDVWCILEGDEEEQWLESIVLSEPIPLENILLNGGTAKQGETSFFYIILDEHEENKLHGYTYLDGAGEIIIP